MRRVRDDYRAWHDLGPGDLPANPIGWVITSALRPLRRDPFTVRGLDAYSDGAHDTDGQTSDWNLPERPGNRPTVAPYPIPHRQTHPIAAGSRTEVLSAAIPATVDRDPKRFRLARSGFEKRGQALFVASTHRATPEVRASGGEIAHVHPGDGSMHVVADPHDASTIIERGWGELHPLAGRPLIGLPESYVLLYAPDDDDQLRVIMSIIDRVVATAVGDAR